MRVGWITIIGICNLGELGTGPLFSRPAKSTKGGERATLFDKHQFSHHVDRVWS